MLSEIDTKKNLSIPVEDLSNILVQCHNENMILREEILKLRKDTNSLTKNMGSVLQKNGQPISARQIADNAEKSAMKLIFPDARKKPFCLVSLRNLISFVNNPTSAEFTSPLAPAEWAKLGSEQTDAIKENVQKFLNSHPFLTSSINTLKKNAWKQEHSNTTINEIVEFYKKEGDDESAEAVEECMTFLESLKK